MRTNINKFILGCTLALGGLTAGAQGLEGIVVEEFHTVTQADADYINNDLGNSSFSLAPGSKVYRVYVDMAPNYRLLTVGGSVPDDGNGVHALDFSTTTTFWNDDNFGSEFPAQTRRASTGTLFDTYITIGSTGIVGGTSPCGALGSGLAQVGLLRAADTNGDLTSCGVFPGFTGNDGSIPGTVPALTTNLSGIIDFTALTGSASSFVIGGNTGDSYATLPANTGVDPTTTNRVLIGQFTTDGVFSFHINVVIQSPIGENEFYVWANPIQTEVVSPFLTYPSAACNPPVLGTPTSNGPICAGAALNLSASATGDATINYSWAGPNSFSSTQQNPSIAAATIAATGTYTVTASNGCAPDASGTVNVVVNPTTNNTTTVSECDSYTWAVNGTTYTQSGTYTSVSGCATQTLVLTITPSTNNTTTVSECDSYTWAENGTTYTQSGTYTNVVGCATETLVLTITPSTNNTTTVSECDSYTWSVNGTTYTQSGTYTNVVGCATETLVLTILQSGNNTTTESACDSYTWSVNGTTYTQSGTYTAVTGCSTETLVLTITPSTNNTTTETACSSYTWAVNGTTYTQSGTYTNVVGCATETLVLTVNIPGTACDDGNSGTINDQLDANCVCVGQPSSTDCLGVIGGTALPGTPCDDLNANTGSDTWSANCQCEGQVIDCNGVIGGLALPGTPCDDNNTNTINDIFGTNCTCAGTPVGPNTECVSLEITTDANSSETSWEIVPEGGGAPLCNGAALPSSSTITESCCLPVGCYALRVLDSAGDGIANGGYVLRETASGERIIDNRGNFSTGAESSIQGLQGFCLPIGGTSLIGTACDKLDWVNYKYLVCQPEPSVANEWINGGANNVQDANSGYEFWMFDANGTYSYRKFRSHNVSDGKSPANANRACHMKINGWYNSALTPLIPQNSLINVRVRGRVNGVSGVFGPACTMVIDPLRAACPLIKLLDLPGDSRSSCNVTRNYGNGNYIWATPPQFIPAVSAAQLRFQFRFRNMAEGFETIRTSNNYVLQLNWTGADALQCGTEYTVDVRVSKDGGATWCIDGSTPATPFQPWGEVCTLTIAPCANITGTTTSLRGESTLTMYPNPNNGGQLFISLNEVAADVNTVSMDIFDMTGKRVAARTITVQDGFINQSVELNGELAGGLYMVNITAGDKTFSERLVIQP